MGVLDGKTALVTGASGGIGRALALRLARAGAAVAVHYNSHAERAADLVAAIEATGRRAIALSADLRSVPAIASMFTALAEQKFEALDILVNNAGIGVTTNLAQTSEALFDDVVDTNVKGPFFVTQAALPLLREGGSIIAISSMVSLSAYPGCIAYAMSKAALNAFTRSLAAELGPRHIRVNAIAPGATETEFIGAYMQNPALVSALEGLTALGRIGKPDDIAAAVEFLASPGGAWITGQVIQASGGMGRIRLTRPSIISCDSFRCSRIGT